MKNMIGLLFCLLVVHGFGQEISYADDIDRTKPEVMEVLALFENYLHSNPADLKSSPFWNKAEQEKHRQFDFLESEFQPSLYMGLVTKVLSIDLSENSGFIKVSYGSIVKQDSSGLLAIVNYGLKRENGSYKLCNALSINKEKWSCTSLGLVDFYYPPYHQFDTLKAQKLLAFIDETSRNFKVPKKAFEYYLADTYLEIQRLKGFDYAIGEKYSSGPSGKASADKVYCGGLGEYYPHEVFHVLVDPQFPNRHFWASEGIATLLGGSRGKSLDWHLIKTHHFLLAHPEIDLNHMLELRNMDLQTAFHYVLGGLIARRLYEAGGWEMLIALMQSGNTDTDYYQAIEDFLGVKQANLNAYIRKELALEVSHLSEE